MKKCKLTEKNMSNKHFFKTEQAISVAYYRNRDYPTVKKITRCANISRSTFYRHHQTASHILCDYEEFLFKSYIGEIKKYLRKNTSLRLIFLSFLTFVSSHKAVVKILFREGRKDIIKRMLNRIKPLVISDWRSSNDFDKAYSIYENEILGVIETWSKQYFSTTRLNQVLNEVLYLTRIAPRHLAYFTKTNSLK